MHRKDGYLPRNGAKGVIVGLTKVLNQSFSVFCDICKKRIRVTGEVSQVFLVVSREGGVEMLCPQCFGERLKEGVVKEVIPLEEYLFGGEEGFPSWEEVAGIMGEYVFDPYFYREFLKKWVFWGNEIVWNEYLKGKDILSVEVEKVEGERKARSLYFLVYGRGGSEIPVLRKGAEVGCCGVFFDEERVCGVFLKSRGIKGETLEEVFSLKDGEVFLLKRNVESGNKVVRKSCVREGEDEAGRILGRAEREEREMEFFIKRCLAFLKEREGIILQYHSLIGGEYE